MALVYNLDPLTRKPHRHNTPVRRRTTANYDRYGFPITSSSPTNGKDTLRHVLHVNPGVVVNFIEASSSTSRSRSWTMPRIIEYNTSRKSSYSQFGGERETSWLTTRSPYNRSLEIVDDRKPSNYYREVEQLPPPKDTRQCPVTHHYIPDGHHPEPRYSEPPYLGPRYSEPTYSEPHFSEVHRPETHPLEQHYHEELHESPEHVPSPIDIPIQCHSPTLSDCSMHSFSISDSDSVNFNQVHHGEPCHLDSPLIPLEIPIQTIFSPQSRPPSFDPPAGKASLPLSSSATRTVRFNDDPVLPSPPPRRKGWWNRKGDQLWDNDGAYAAAPEHDLYPPDLRNYPEPGSGWMNEEGTRIDMKRRLVRKKPLRSAMKKPPL